MSDVYDTTAPDDELKLPIYGELLGRKLVVPSTRTGYVAVDQFLFFELMSRRLHSVEVNEEWYLNTYPDIRSAICSGEVKSAAHHYRHFGYFEHRLPREINVDSAWYLEAHPDVRDAIAKKVYTSAQEHYIISGFSEGRLPYAGFDLFTSDATS